MQQDPAGYVDGMNRYQDAGSNPTNLLDPLGLDGWTRFWGGVKAVGGAVQAVGGFGFAVLTAETGVGAVGGGIVGLKGLDDLQAGLRQAFSGEETNTLTYDAVKKATGSCLAANVVDIGIDLAGSGAASKGLQALRELGAAKTVLGFSGEYESLADKLGANKFVIPDDVWAKMSDAERWAANQQFLDSAISRGDKIVLATNPSRVTPGRGFYWRELQYLASKGYQVSPDGTALLPPARFVPPAYPAGRAGDAETGGGKDCGCR
jgi:hypothetical protein